VWSREGADTQQRQLKRRTETHRRTRRVPGFGVTLSDTRPKCGALARASASWDPDPRTMRAPERCPSEPLTCLRTTMTLRVS